jgi:hypothetical protein
MEVGILVSRSMGVNSNPNMVITPIFNLTQLIKLLIDKMRFNEYG